VCSSYLEMFKKRKCQEEDVMDGDSSEEDYDDDTDVDVSDDDSDVEEEPDLKRSLSTMTWPLPHSTIYQTHHGQNCQYRTQSHKDLTEQKELEEKSQSNQSGSEVSLQQATTQLQSLRQRTTTPLLESCLHHGTETQGSHH